MASLFQIRRGSGSVDLLAGELYNNQTSRSLQIGIVDSGSITLAKLNETNSGSFDISGDLFVSGNARIVGNLTFGDSDAIDTVTVVASFSSSLIPQSTNNFDLGETTTYWKTGYISSITGSLSGSVDNINVTQFSASVSESIGTLNNTAAVYDSRLDNLEQHSSSVNDFTASITASYNATSESLNIVSQSLLDVSASYIATSQSFDIVSSSLLTFSSSQYNADSTSFDNRLDLVETTASILTDFSASISTSVGLLQHFSSSEYIADSSSVSNQLIGIEAYTASLKTAITASGQDITIYGNLTVQGTQTAIQSTILNVVDKNITLASGSTDSATANGAGINIDGANVTMSWSDANQRIELNKDLAVTGSISSSTINGIGNVTEYSSSVNGRLVNLEATGSEFDSRLDVLEAFSSSIKTEVSNSVSGNVNKIAYFDDIHSVTDFVHSFIGASTFGLGTSATSSEAERLMVDNGQSYNIATFQTSKQDSYAEVNIKNFGSGSNSSADLVIWNDVSTESSSFVDLGINSSNYSAGFVGYGGDSYLINAANDLYVGSLLSGSHGHLHLFAGNLWDSSSINVYADGTVGINTDKYDNNATTIPHSSEGFEVEVSGSVIFTNNINVSGSVSASSINGIGNATLYSQSVDSRIYSLENFSASQYINDSSSFDTRISASTLAFNDTIGQIGVDFTKVGTQVSAIVGGLSTTSSVQFNNITASNSISASGTVYCDTLVATTLVGATLPVLEYETNGTLGNILIKGATSKAIQVVDSITFNGLSQNGSDQYSATGLLMTGSITASLGFSGSVDGIGNVTLYSQSVAGRLNTIETTYATTGSNIFSGSQYINGDITASNLYISGAIYTYELHTIIESSSVFFSSGSNQIGDQQNDVLTITGSLYQTGSTTFSELSGSLFDFSASLNNRINNSISDVTTLSSSIYQTDATQSNNILTNSASAWGAFQSASSYSASIYTRDANQDTQITNASASAWGAFQSASSYSSSLQTSITTLSSSVVTLSSSVASRLASEEFYSTTFATTGSNQFKEDQSITGSLYVTGDVVAYSTSDERLKDNIQLISNPIQKVNELRGVEFDWKDGMPKAGQHDYGVIAQDVIKVMPELVNQRPDGYFAVDYDKIIGLLIEVVKEQEKRIKDLENKIG